MELEELKIDSKITTSDLNKVKKWLEKEHELLGNGSTGMIKNFEKTIKPAAKKGDALLYRRNNLPIGILVFSTSGKKVFLDIIDIDPNYRRQGYGKRFVEDYIKYFVSKGIIVAELEPVTDDGLSLCKSTGFKEETYSCYKPSYYYKTFVEIRRQNRLAKCRLAIWAKVNFDINEEPTFSWSLNFKTDKKPIIQYAYQDWGIGIIKDGKIVAADKVKYFNDDIIGFHNVSYPFIYIDEHVAKKLI